MYSGSPSLYVAYAALSSALSMAMGRGAEHHLAGALGRDRPVVGPRVDVPAGAGRRARGGGVTAAGAAAAAPLARRRGQRHQRHRPTAERAEQATAPRIEVPCRRMIVSPGAGWMLPATCGRAPAALRWARFTATPWTCSRLPATARRLLALRRPRYELLTRPVSPTGLPTTTPHARRCTSRSAALTVVRAGGRSLRGVAARERVGRAARGGSARSPPAGSLRNTAVSSAHPSASGRVH
jgi:hypothetical protein